MTDLTYFDDGLFTRFMPSTPAGETAWRVIAGQTDGTGKVLTIHAASTCQQLRTAGYSVAKGKRAAPAEGDEDALLSALEA